MSKIKINSLDDFEQLEGESNYEKMRSKRPKQNSERKVEKKNHRKRKLEI